MSDLIYDPGKLNREKTHCPQSHEYTEENTYINPSGSRQCRTCRLAAHERWIQQNPESRQDIVRRANLKRQYNLTIEQYDEMLSAQDGRCAGCGNSHPGNKTGVFFVDHCHTTGKVRGLLCLGCNSALGHIKDDIETLKQLIKYLEEN